MSKEKFWIFVIITLVFSMIPLSYAVIPFENNLKINSCIAQSQSEIEIWDAVCDGTYPNDCPTNKLICNDNKKETHKTKTAGSNPKYAGIKIHQYNSSVTDCKEISFVELCYEWWGDGNKQNCEISVDANNDSNWEIVTTNCPGTSSNPGVTCTNITNLESWTCENFFGEIGTKAQAKSNLYVTNTGKAKTIKWDVFYFNVEYIKEKLNISILYPQENVIYNTNSLFIRTKILGENDSCWYNLNNAGNIYFTCGTEPNITAIEGFNSLTVYVNNSNNLISNDSINFSVNTSVDLTINIISPLNNTISTSASPIINLIASDSLYDQINYTIFIYHNNNSLYAKANTGTLTSNIEQEITLTLPLTLIGNLSSYKIITNATDQDNNQAISNSILYTLTFPAVELVSPDHNYWDSNGDIDFDFKVYDEAFPNISCSLYLNNILNQTNDNVLTNGTLTTFNLNNINDASNQEWKIYCIDAQNNEGEDSRNFNVDSTPPTINSINDSPDPLNQSHIVNITANVTDNIQLKEVIANISGTRYYMTHLTEDFYSYEYDTTDLNGIYNYTIEAYDILDNKAIFVSGNFTVLCISNITNTSWTAWHNTSCYSNNTLDQSRNITQYDANGCGEVSNSTHLETGIANCTYIPPKKPFVFTGRRGNNDEEENETEEVEEEIIIEECPEHWTCTSWTKCEKNQQIRSCDDWNNCNTTKLKPAEKRKCGYEEETIKSPGNMNIILKDKITDLELKEKQKIEFIYNKEKHYLTVDNIQEDKVYIIIESKPIKEILFLNQPITVDIDFDGIIDLRIVLHKIQDKMAHITITALGEGLTSITGHAIKIYPNKTPNPYYIIPSVMLIVILIVLFSIKKTHLSQKKKKILTTLHFTIIGIILLIFFSAIIKNLQIGEFIANLSQNKNEFIHPLTIFAFILAAISSAMMLVERKKINTLIESQKVMKTKRKHHKKHIVHNLKKIYKV